MKKFLLSSLLICVAFSPLALSAQKKTTPIRLANEADSVSYALGIMMVQSGLKQHLVQMKVIADTMAVSSEYQSKIENETNAAQKSKLQKELKFKVDSINKSNSKNIEEFLTGFNQSLNQDKDKSAYNSGVAIGTQLSSATENFSKELLGGEGLFKMEAFVAAFAGSLRDEDPIIDNAETLIQDASMRATQVRETKAADDKKSEYAAQIAEGEAFFAQNKAKDGVVTLPSGLQYKVLTQGSGEKPTASDRVTVHYKGTLLDGTVFDSSIERGEPNTFGVNQVIKGWSEALQLMPVGSKWIIYIPYELAYGSREQGAIKPFSNLIFEVELIAIDKD
ncbi:MAG: FKBP-type peptidyl-prolyl cis-trans isomerase [Prevotella sp.]|nr:FKBP-type peptidyl-prolyl cis-trans isomerase [Prevotella sp.]